MMPRKFRRADMESGLAQVGTILIAQAAEWIIADWSPWRIAQLRLLARRLAIRRPVRFPVWIDRRFERPADTGCGRRNFIHFVASRIDGWRFTAGIFRIGRRNGRACHEQVLA